MPGMVVLSCAHVDNEGRACLDGSSGQPWYRPYGGSSHQRYARAYLGVPGAYDPVASERAASAEWDL